jgi:hypothetical protein
VGICAQIQALRVRERSHCDVVPVSNDHSGRGNWESPAGRAEEQTWWSMKIATDEVDAQPGHSGASVVRAAYLPTLTNPL